MLQAAEMGQEVANSTPHTIMFKINCRATGYHSRLVPGPHRPQGTELRHRDRTEPNALPGHVRKGPADPPQHLYILIVIDSNYLNFLFTN